jgi:hypothetical protein
MTAGGRGSRRVRSLSLHADYRCRNSGVCCGTDWDVPMELPVYRSLRAAVDAGQLKVSPESGTLAPFVVDPELPPDAAAVFERTDHGNCVFFDSGSRLCMVHRDLGEGALAVTCRTFPRLSIDDPRGTFVALSHFCPTAASLLFRDDVPIGIVFDPPAFPPADYDGLAVTPDDLPPLLHPDMLMDLDGYEAWEQHMVERCAIIHAAPEMVLATLARDAEVLRAWRPGPIALADAVRALPRDVVEVLPEAALDLSLVRYEEVRGAAPEDLRPPPDVDGLADAFEKWVRPAWPRWSAPLCRYLAAKAFATWTAYQGKGVATIVRGLEAALALVRVEAARQCRDAGRALDANLLKEAIRSADFALNHVAIGEELAEAWSAAETRPRGARP